MVQALLKELTAITGIGCGHLKAIMRSPDLYDTPQQLTQWFLTAFFEYMWLEDAERSKQDKKLLYVVLQVCVAVIYNKHLLINANQNLRGTTKKLQ